MAYYSIELAFGADGEEIEVEARDHRDMTDDDEPGFITLSIIIDDENALRLLFRDPDQIAAFASDVTAALSRLGEA